MFDPGLLPVFLVLVLAAIIALVVLSIQAAKKRREDLAALAASFGMQYSPGDPFRIPDAYSSFSWISQGHNRGAYNVLWGQREGFDIKAFDYYYHTTQSSTDSKGHHTTREERHEFSAVVADTSVLFRGLTIRPEGFFDRVASAVGFDDFDFESAEFSRRFYVKGEDKKFAYGVVHARMMEFLLANRGMSVEMNGHSVMVCTSRTLRVEEFPKSMAFLSQFLKLLPDYLWKDLAAPTGGTP